MKRANTDLIRQRNEAIYRDFSELSDVQHLRTDYVLERLQQKYYLQRETIYKIVRSQNSSCNGY